MEGLNKQTILSIIIPTLNEASKLPLLLADLNRSANPIEILVIDGKSDDLTRRVAKLGGANVFNLGQANRGLQLGIGGGRAKSNWLLFLHADSRLTTNWFQHIEQIIQDPAAENSAWFFNLRIKSKAIEFRIMEAIVSIRSNYLKKPYGDQGLLITRSLYKKVGGYKSLHLMEDLEIISRIQEYASLKSLKMPIYTDPRRWENKSIIVKSLKNAILRYRWSKGESTTKLLKDYYSK